MHTTALLEHIAEFLNKQDLLSKLTESEDLHGYSYSEIHTIEAIGNLDFPNVSAIAQHLHMTKGAISKITKRLISAGAIEPYHKSGNNQKVFFRLTKTGGALYEEHENRHMLWIQRDNRFLSRFSHWQIEEITAFLAQFNAYLALQIKECEDKNHAD